MTYDILALCSGGFDSIVMLHQIREENPEAQILVVHFNYFQKNKEQEFNATAKVCKKLNLEFKPIYLPKFDWTDSYFYREGFSADKEYLEMRNLIFISYALSVCESYKISKMYMATLKSLGYYDTSEAFLSKVKGIALDKGIELCTPYSELTKWDLVSLAYYYGINREDFFTCDNPIDGKPCGDCPDCKTLEDMYEDIDVNTPAKAWAKTFDPCNSDFTTLFRSEPIQEIRLLINNDCQLNCRHCYYGFNSMVGDRLTVNEFKNVFKQAKSLGIESFHFAGKEPMFDDFMFTVSDEIRKVIPNAELTVVTNGITVPKYADKLKEYNFAKVFLSVDDIGNTSLVRGVSNVTHKALTALNKVGVPFEIFIDLHTNNYNKIPEIMCYLNDCYQAQNFYVRTIVSIGNADKNDIPKLNVEQLNTTFKQLSDFADKRPDIFMHLTLSIEYTYTILRSGVENELSNAVACVFDFANRYVKDNFTLFPEAYCGKYENQITITPDGYVHGCASEVSCKNYDKISVGNVKDTPLKELINKGKNLALRTNKAELDNDGKLKFFSCTCCNPIDNT